MSDTRMQNRTWNVRASDGTLYWDGIQIAILMDIRDELQALNRRINCHETMAIPRILREIRRNTTERKRKKT